MTKRQIKSGSGADPVPRKHEGLLQRQERGRGAGLRTPPTFSLPSQERQALTEILAQGSKSFAMASRLLPARMRDAVLVYYAYCRHADDAIDESAEPKKALETLIEELDAVFSGAGGQDLVTRELTRLVAGSDLSKAPFVGLLEGFAWDTQKKRYETLEELECYCARVAATVGITMTELMGPSSEQMLARAADLGVAMQLTNIARDIGTDARANRLYVPLEWMRSRGLEPEQWLERPVFCQAMQEITQELLKRAAFLYERCESGVAALPKDCRSSIYAARLIYADIGRMIQKQGWDTVSERAYVRLHRKLVLLLQSLLFPPKDRAQLPAPPLAATAWLCASTPKTSR